MMNTLSRFVAVSAAATLFCSGARAEAPRIVGSTIVFSNGRRMTFTPIRRIHVDPEAAAARHEPVEVREKATIIEEWQRVLIVKEMRMFEGDAGAVRIIDYSGRTLATHRFVGQAVPLVRTRRILLAQRSDHHVVEESFILDIDGATVARVPQRKDTFTFGHAADEKVIWMFAAVVEAGRPLVLTTIISCDGKLIQRVKTKKAQTIQVTVDGKTYPISVPEPRLPG